MAGTRACPRTRAACSELNTKPFLRKEGVNHGREYYPAAPILEAGWEHAWCLRLKLVQIALTDARLVWLKPARHRGAGTRTEGTRLAAKAVKAVDDETHQSPSSHHVKANDRSEHSESGQT